MAASAADFIDLFFANGHVCEDGDRFLRDLDKARPDRQTSFLAALHDPELSGNDLRHQGDVLRKDAELSLGAGNHNGIHIVRKGLGFRSDDLESKSGHKTGFSGVDDLFLDHLDAALHIEVGLH